MRRNSAGIIIIGLALVSVITSGTAAATYDRWDDSLAIIIQSSRSMHLPCDPLENKIREGRAKNRSAAEIYPVVKARQKHLMQIRDNKQGTFSQGYTKQLFELESSNIPKTQTVEKPVHSSPRHPLPVVPVATVKTTFAKNSNDLDAPEKQPLDNPATAGNCENTRHIDRKLIRADKKAEKTMDKAASRAEKRMKIVEKQMRKRAMKQHGTGK